MTRTDGAAQRPIVEVAHDLDIALEYVEPYAATRPRSGSRRSRRPAASRAS
ncbi:MAG: hypothetical protein ABSH35_23085 [Isosphaeraceae bacterium]|jgi:hypothetical protein